jgi:hypothetical protein
VPSGNQCKKLKKMAGDAAGLAFGGTACHFFIKEAGKIVTTLDLRRKVSYNK